MKLPRDISGEALARLLRRYGYAVTRQTGSHMRLTSSIRGFEHHVTIPNHRSLRAGTLSSIVGQVARYVGRERGDVIEELFG